MGSINRVPLEVVLHDYALYKSTFTLLYFTNLPGCGGWGEGHLCRVADNTV